MIDFDALEIALNAKEIEYDFQSDFGSAAGKILSRDGSHFVSFKITQWIGAYDESTRVLVEVWTDMDPVAATILTKILNNALRRIGDRIAECQELLAFESDEDTSNLDDLLEIEEE